MMDFSRQDLPSTADLPYSDGRPMDNDGDGFSYPEGGNMIRV
jgi:hypothetical protein